MVAGSIRWLRVRKKPVGQYGFEGARSVVIAWHDGTPDPGGFHSTYFDGGPDWPSLGVSPASETMGVLISLIRTCRPLIAAEYEAERLLWL